VHGISGERTNRIAPAAAACSSVQTKRHEMPAHHNLEHYLDT
jgi:hypothetical protein